MQKSSAQESARNVLHSRDWSWVLFDDRDALYFFVVNDFKIDYCLFGPRHLHLAQHILHQFSLYSLILVEQQIDFGVFVRVWKRSDHVATNGRRLSSKFAEEALHRFAIRDADVVLDVVLGDVVDLKLPQLASQV